MQKKGWLLKIIINWIVFAAPVYAAGTAVLVHCISIRYNFTVMAVSPEALIAAKTTFLSVIIALGMFQYSYFYTENASVQERFEKGEYGSGWSEYIQSANRTKQVLEEEGRQLASSQRLLDLAQRIAGQQPTQTQLANRVRRFTDAVNARAQGAARLRTNLQEMENAIQNAKAEFAKYMRRVLLDLTLRISLIFAIGLLAFASLTFDLVPLILPSSKSIPFALYSQSAFLASLSLFLLLFVFFLWVVQVQARFFNKG